jgi:hypothetical protein
VSDDWREKQLSAEGREYADKGLPPKELPDMTGTTYQYQLLKQTEHRIWMNAYTIRKARIERLKERHETPHTSSSTCH